MSQGRGCLSDHVWVEDFTNNSKGNISPSVKGLVKKHFLKRRVGKGFHWVG